MSELDLPRWATELLRDTRTAHLATADSGGRPLVVAICYVFDGELLYSAIDAKPKTTRWLRRVRNIDENPRVSLIVDHWDEDWTRLCHVIVGGEATLVEGGREWHRAVEALQGKYEQYRAMSAESDFGCVIRIEPRTVRCWRADDA